MAGTETATANASEKALADRADAWANLERAFSRRDYEGMYQAAEDLSAAAYALGRTKKKYEPLMEAKPMPDAPPAAAPTSPAPANGGWTVGEIDATRVTLRPGTKIFLVLRPGHDTAAGAIAFCDNRENAELIAKALSAQGA